MKKIILLLLILIIGFFLHGSKNQPLNNLLNPLQIVVESLTGEMFVVDGTEIKVFSLKELTLKGKFGKQGEGPGELLPPISINLSSDTILINSRNKVSFHNRELVFVRELKVTSGKRFAWIRDGFAGQGFKIIGQDGYETFNFYDKDLVKGEEIVSRKSPIQRGGKIPVLSTPFIFRSEGSRVFYSFNDQLEIGISDKGKKNKKSIRMDYKNKPFTASDKAAFENYFKTNPRTKKNYEMLRQRLVYPTHYPAIRTFLIDDEKIYLLTYKKNKNGSSEMFIFKTGGKLLKESILPVRDMNIFRPYPFTISNGKLYQLIETKDEKWELHINQI